MKPHPRARAVVLVASLLAAFPIARAAEPATTDWAAKQPDGDPVRIAIETADKRHHHLGWPKAVRMANGTIVVAYLAAVHHTAGGCPAVSVSTDAGKSFTPPHILHDFPAGKEYQHSGNLGIAIAEDGSLVVLAMAFTGDTRNAIFGWRSTDSGKNWAAVDTTALGPNKTGSVASMTHVPGVGLMAFGHYRKPSEPRQTGIWSATSKDNGRTWSEPALVSDVEGVEPTVVLAGDRLLVFIRTGKTPGHRQHVAVSDDKGKTWKTQLTEIGVEKSGTLAHPFAMVNPDKPEELLVLTTERPQPGKVWLWRGDHKTLEFRRDRIVLEFPKYPNDNHADYGYTWLVPIEKGRGLMFYYHGMVRGASPIWIAEVTY